MKKLVTILAAVMLITMMGMVNAQADTWLLGSTFANYGNLFYDGTSFYTSGIMKYTYSLAQDPHMWDNFAGNTTTYSGNHKFQSAAVDPTSTSYFQLTINSGMTVDAYDTVYSGPHTPAVPSLTSSNNYWAITDVKTSVPYNSTLRGLSVENIAKSTVAGTTTITGTLVADGIFHWYGNFADTNMWTVENYNNKLDFTFIGTASSDNLYTGSMNIYANNVPIPGALVLLGGGLVRLARYSRRKKALI
jgi:hypothetical protein